MPRSSLGFDRRLLLAATVAALLLPGAAHAAPALPLDLPGTDALRFDGSARENAGFDVAAGCDLNDDGLDDVAIGAPFATVAGTPRVGRVYIVPGSPNRTSSAGYDLATGGAQAPAGSIAVEGDPAEGVAGMKLDCAGDVNGDDVDDLVLSAPGEGTTGRAYVVFGDAQLGSGGAIRLDALGAGGFVISSWSDSLLGWDVAGLGDLDGDGKSEIAVSDDWGDARGAGPAYPGTVYVIAGKASTAPVDLTDPASTLIRIHGAADNDRLASVAGPGDVDGDGTPDLLAGSFMHDGPNGPDSGAAYVVSGDARGTVDLGTTPGGSSGILFAIEGPDVARQGGVSAYLGRTLAAAGDVNGDGKQDVAVTSHAGGGTGSSVWDAVHVVYGKSDAAPVDLDAPGSGAYEVQGPPRSQVTDRFGAAIAPLGDVDGDGHDDLAVGAYSASSPVDENAGGAYVLYGLTQPHTVSIAEMTCRDGARIFGTVNGNRFGAAVAATAPGFGPGRAPYLVVAADWEAGSVRAIPLRAVAGACEGAPDPSAGALDVDWGLRENFRRYVSNGFDAANPARPITATGGAVCDVNPDAVRGGCDPRLRSLPSDPPPARALRWTPIGAGAVDGSDTTVATIGTVVFRYPGHYFTLTVQDPWLVIASGTVTLRARVKLEVADGFAGARPVDVRLPFGEFQLDGAPTVTAQSVVWRTLPGRLSDAAGQALGGFLGVGAQLDPVTIVIPRSLGALGDEPGVPAPPVPRDRPRADPPAGGRSAATTVGTIAPARALATVRRAGGVLLGRVSCRAAICRLGAPRTIRLRVAAGGGRRARTLRVRVAVPRQLVRGRRGEVRLVLDRAAVRALAGRFATARVRMSVNADGRRVVQTLTLALRGAARS